MASKKDSITFQKRDDRKTKEHCCVPKCTASSKFNSCLSFHSFPKDRQLRKKWEENIRRDKFIVTGRTRICSRHFTEADVNEASHPGGRRRLQKEAIPVLFQWNSYSLPGVWESRPLSPTIPHVEEDGGPVEHSEHNYCSTLRPTAVDLAPEETKDLRAENALLRKQIEEMAISCRFGLERFASSDDDIMLYTRYSLSSYFVCSRCALTTVLSVRCNIEISPLWDEFSSYAHLKSFWSQIEPALTGKVCVTIARPAPHFKEANAISLQPIDEFFLFLMYLALGLGQSDLASRFGIHQSTVTQIINTWANFLYNVLGAVGIWLDEETIKRNLPEIFQDYSDTHIILYFTELHFQTPGSHLLQSEVFSNFKSYSTFKGLVGIAPHGPVMFISPLYEGSISDGEIAKCSGLWTHLRSDMAIMVVKGFLVEDVVPCKVHIPAFLKRKAHMSKSEIRKIRSITRLRVHVEQVISRVKENKLFSTVVPVSLTGSIHQLFAVACLLVNYQN